MRRCSLLVLVLVAWHLVEATPCAAHGGHTQQPPGIIDPLVTHHAILEDELKLNYFGARWGAGRLVSETGSLELAVVFEDWVGAELFVPFGFVREGGALAGGLGDLELQVPKLSFVRERGLVMTTYVAVRAPTGEPFGIGEPGWTFAPHLLADIGVERFGAQINVAVEVETSGEVAFEGNLSLAYSVALSPLVTLSPLAELSLEAPLDADPQLVLTPGVKLSFEGFHVGLGVQLPLTDAREFDVQALIQIGYHVPWAQWFGVGA